MDLQVSVIRISMPHWYTGGGPPSSSDRSGKGPRDSHPEASVINATATKMGNRFKGTAAFGSYRQDRSTVTHSIDFTHRCTAMYANPALTKKPVHEAMFPNEWNTLLW